MRACLSVEIGRVQTKATCPRQTDGRARGARFFPARSFLWFGMRAHAIGPLHERQKQHRQKRGGNPTLCCHRFQKPVGGLALRLTLFVCLFFSRTGSVPWVSLRRRTLPPPTPNGRDSFVPKSARAHMLLPCVFSSLARLGVGHAAKAHRQLAHAPAPAGAKAPDGEARRRVVIGGPSREVDEPRTAIPFGIGKLARERALARR